ncbi:MAG: Bro-N domain-containing protein [Desulfobacteraceae bacterium]|nr:Bro-N domain-containing protein [Desulfobacteraceae bacterium]
MQNVSDAVNRLDDDEKDIVLIDTLGGHQKSRIINESGLYVLIMSSRKSEAKAFRR